MQWPQSRHSPMRSGKDSRERYSLHLVSPQVRRSLLPAFFGWGTTDVPEEQQVAYFETYVPTIVFAARRSGPLSSPRFRFAI